MIMHGTYFPKRRFFLKMVIRIIFEARFRYDEFFWKIRWLHMKKKIQQFQISKMQGTNSNWLQSKSDGKHRLSLKFSYVITIYQVWNNDNTRNVLFTSCAISIFFWLNKKLFYLHVNLETWEPFVHVFWKNIITFKRMCMSIFKMY